ncbi:hypothetical protein SAMN02745220_02874 [Desulfopila aestuarii DSM 18488]|uniref:Uncharacterized protein n=2 Tax=Desulfopila aestuarii TaxID=231440 RepID=A0A1M7YA51_9BACT|nr:hypothetical protein SAMN02745220_02874 [Desulfopila aestuarii DSM 18488]
MPSCNDDTMMNFKKSKSLLAENVTRKSALATAMQIITIRRHTSSIHLVDNSRPETDQTFSHQATLSPFSWFPSSQKIFFSKIRYFDIFQPFAPNQQIVRTKHFVHIGTRQNTTDQGSSYCTIVMSGTQISLVREFTDGVRTDCK